MIGIEIGDAVVDAVALVVATRPAAGQVAVVPAFNGGMGRSETDTEVFEVLANCDVAHADFAAQHAFGKHDGIAKSWLLQGQKTAIAECN